MRTIHTRGRKPDVRKAIKLAAKEGGHYEVVVDMRPTDAHDAQTLLYLARGSAMADVVSWRSRIGEKIAASHRWPSRPGRAYDYAADAESLRVRGPGYRFTRDAEYEARMAAWALTFAYCGADRAMIEDAA